MEGPEEQKYLSPAEYDRQLQHLVNTVSSDAQTRMSWSAIPVAAPLNPVAGPLDQK